jgi:hypothetical protein
VTLRLGLVSIIFSLLSCNYTRFKDDSTKGGKSPLTKAEGEAIGFNRILNEVIEPYCLSCHRKQLPLLRDYPEVKAHLDGIRNTVFVIKSMPKRRVLPADKRSLLLAWLDAGAPDVGKIAEPEIPPLQPTFSSIRDRIFKVRCGDCHEPTSPFCSSATIHSGEDHSKGSCELELTDYNELLFGEEESRKEIVVPNDPDSSMLVISIEREDGKDQMPPPEDGYSPLSAEEKKAIRDWISAGAPNN